LYWRVVSLPALVALTAIDILSFCLSKVN